MFRLNVYENDHREFPVMRLKRLVMALLSLMVLVVVPKDNGLWGGYKDLGESQIQRDQRNIQGNHAGMADSNHSAEQSGAYPRLPD